MRLVELKGVTQEYRKKNILETVNFSINQGDLFGIIGTSGSGKTTLLNIISGFVEPTEGEVLYYSKVTETPKILSKDLAKVKREIGFTPQHNSFYPKLTVKENLWHFGQLYGIKKETLKSNINVLLEVTHLDGHQNKLADQLSGGMQKRLDISCSLVHNPRLLILDEPTADLDPILQKELSKMLQAINKQGVTIVLASHQLESVEKMCDRIAMVHNGKVNDHGLLDEVRKPYLQDHFTITVRSKEKREQIIRRLKELPIKKIVEKEHSLVIYPRHNEKVVTNLMELIEEEDLQLRELEIRKPSLAKIFEKIVKED